jgi:hypothetical protein
MGRAWQFVVLPGLSLGGRDSAADAFLLGGDYGDCYPCLDCPDDRDVETPMSFRLAFQ